MMENYKEKIKKLLALSESSNEYEAKAALLKAKQLMMEHKISESDLADKTNAELKKLASSVTFGARRDPWIGVLANVLADNYMCRFVGTRYSGMQTTNVEFWGLEDDVEICLKVFEYSVDCVHSECNRIKKENSSCSAQERNALCTGYAIGFISGIRDAFEEQNEANKAKWGLVPVMTEEVARSTDGLKTVSSHLSGKARYHSVGYAAGKNFNMGNRVAAN